MSDIQIQELADKLHLTPHYTGKIFRDAIGKSIIDYTNELRLQLASHLLLKTNIKISEIATQIGYTNSTYFIRRFHKQYGISPMQYRNKSS